jgi:hypothetical protein
MASRDLEGQYARWALLISEYDFNIVYRLGVEHAVADTPSRDPLPSTIDRTGAREPVHEFQHSLISCLTALHTRMDVWADMEPEVGGVYSCFVPASQPPG